MPALTTPDEISAYVREVQSQYGLGPSFYDTLECESQGWQNKQSEVRSADGPNGRENSWGVAQIWLDPRGHPDITQDEALDVRWAVVWAAQEFAAGRAWLWTCWRRLNASKIADSAHS